MAYISYGGSLYYIFYSILIFWITMTFSKISFDEDEIANNLLSRGAVIGGVRTGENTAEYLSKVTTRLNFIAGCYLVIVCVLCEFFCTQINNYIGLNVLFFSGTSILILISVAQMIFKGASNYNYMQIFSDISYGFVINNKNNKR